MSSVEYFKKNLFYLTLKCSINNFIMSCEELQEEEFEVLSSIYDGDLNFKQISKTCYQYKIGTDDDPKSFLLEVLWVEQYPNVPPKINLDAFYNKKLVPDVKQKIISELLNQADMWLGTAMTYTLFEYAKDNAEELTKFQPDTVVLPESTPFIEEKNVIVNEETVSSSKKEKKPKLSKQQKRKLAEKLDAKGERPRGWDWVDIVKHLSQIGPKPTTNDATS
ncbi:RWD domain-containing protein 4 isoform X1 [Parasteatoda tepidariorum]|uniref:RWD domain-containing protein 4 isoform X1 n=2 Tax=Parasteatoda tepidariorum TaxID=114398 RepID=UPI001C723D4D|nr:RWD domain-containing protein 4 isoform X1 [Parasteatoda tepidariorum]